MTVQRWAAICLAAAFVAMALSTVLIPPKLYATNDIDERLRIIETFRTRWLANQIFVFCFGVLVIAGFCLLASALQTDGRDWTSIVGAAAMVVGTLSGLYFAYLQVTNPRGGYSGTFPVPENLAYWFWLAGMVLFGVAFVLTDLPDWLGYATAVVGIAYAAVFLTTRAGFMTPFILALICLMIAIVLFGR